MPASMAACRTVLPLATVTGRPSMVSVTVSITGRSYQQVGRRLSRRRSVARPCIARDSCAPARDGVRCACVAPPGGAMEATRVRFGSLARMGRGRGRVIAAVLRSARSSLREFRTVSASDARHRGDSVPIPCARRRSVARGLRPDPAAARRQCASASATGCEAVAARLGARPRSGRSRSSGRRPASALTRFYEHAGTQFVLVFEPFEQDARAAGRGDLPP